MSYHPGKFVWFELSTADFDRASKFYGELLGWKINAIPMSGMDYHMINNGEIPIGGLIPLEGEHSSWLSYLSVENVDQAVSKVKKAGGKLIKEAMDFPNVGRFALVSDPEGGVLFAFRGEKEDAPDRELTHGDWYWNELWAKDADKTAKFYAQCFGVEDEAMDMPGMKYHVLKAEGVSRAGVMNAPVPGIPTHWLPYVRVDRVDEVAKRAVKLGGTVTSEPQDIPTVGRFAIVKDPGGAAFGVITPSQQ